ncbi:MAG: hypothetical protein A2494_01470 [Candidatus Lloydbacteria bacterium RIFOXYC12_FULL_46_25]|uniref:Uncharacterized protein n=1 Tax=Candidatus Lloydbacteria bacterium RIFOXYC12_FULL_46_25 TaxID=1798670 RepID=A0A1G2E1D1_9BACT|nr:MAG: hypothetical protein A2494_01470 [Candidatus Lloydbacteria bacterium RIFOXYC12_FULL_46_25]
MTKIRLMLTIDIDDARGRWLNEIVFKNLFEEEGFASLSRSGDENSSRMTEREHDLERERDSS